MPSDNPKISSYVPQQIYDRFKQYQEDNKLSMSQAVIVILSEYFGIEDTVKENISGSPIGGVTLSAFQDLIKRVEYLESTLEITSDRDDIDEESIHENDVNSELIINSDVIEQVENIGSLPLDFSVDYSIQKIELMGKDFAKRIGLSTSKLSSNKSKKTIEEFTEWSTEQDPDRIGWRYKEALKGKGVLYCPIEETESELLNRLKKWIADNVKN